MTQPHGFSWIERPWFCAMAHPDGVEDLHWLRKQKIDLLVSLTEEPPPHKWVNEAGLLLMHVPMVDMEPPTDEQIDRCISTIQKANDCQMGVAVHCGAGLGRTGVVIACYFVTKGLSAINAIARVRRLRPGSVETDEQADFVERYARRTDRSSSADQ